MKKIFILLAIPLIGFLIPSPVYAQPKSKVPTGILKQIDRTVQEHQRSTATSSAQPTASPTVRPTASSSAQPHIIDTLPTAREVKQDGPTVNDEEFTSHSKIYAQWLGGKVKFWKNESGQMLLSFDTAALGFTCVIAVIGIILLIPFLFTTFKKIIKPKKYKIRRIDL